jgi:hypothetical protein
MQAPEKADPNVISFHFLSKVPHQFWVRSLNVTAQNRPNHASTTIVMTNKMKYVQEYFISVLTLHVTITNFLWFLVWPSGIIR